MLLRSASRPIAHHTVRDVQQRITASRQPAAQRWQHTAAATPPAAAAGAVADAAQQQQAEEQPAAQAHPQQQGQGAMFLVRNETQVPCTLPSGAFLEASPRGAPQDAAALPSARGAVLQAHHQVCPQHH